MSDAAMPAEPTFGRADLTNCDREPIHTPDRVQSFGCLLAIRRADRVVDAASANAGAFLGSDIGGLLGRRLPDGHALASVIEAGLGGCVGRPIRLRIGSSVLAGTAHDGPDGRLLVEVEHEPEDADESAAAVRALADSTNASADLPELAQRVVELVRGLTGFERVKLYRFDAQWHGQVIAESRAPSAESYLGLWFPASDIPPRARALYEQCPVRTIADLAAPQPEMLRARSSPPVDMSPAAVRGVSPIHVEYLSNMRVRSSLTLSVRRGGGLWGLIACHDSAPMVVPPARRALLRGVALTLGQLLTLRAEADQAVAERGLSRLHDGLIASLARAPTPIIAVREHAEAMTSAVGACGLAVQLGDGVEVFGRSPPVGVIRRGVRAAAETAGRRRVFARRSLARDLGLPGLPEGIAGMLACALTDDWSRWIAWFRPEIVETATWAGEPSKSVREDGRLSPRKSFAAWKSSVRGRSAAWSEPSIDAARRLGDSVREFDRVLERRDMAERNAALERRNERLTYFVDSVAHDLRAPLVSIDGFSAVLRRRLAEAGLADTELVDHIDAASGRLRTLLEDLLRVARLDRDIGAATPVDVRGVAEAAAARHRDRAGDRTATIVVSGDAATLHAPPVYVEQVLDNLIVNALKYGCPRPGMRVDVTTTTREDGVIRLAVRDFGPGVAAEDRERVFELFRRLAPGGDGTGVGLYIVRRIATLLGGSVAVSSPKTGDGALFTVTLPAATSAAR